MTSFSSLGLAEPILRALNDAGYQAPTPIQAQAIPEILSGRDLIGIAQTGTGKTAAFALPILDHLMRQPRRLEPKSVRALVLSPTRELSGQIVDNFQAFSRHGRISVGLAIGGVPMGRQVRALHRGTDVLVATPGRLLDLAENNAVRLDQVEVFVLDEADQMLDMGFVHAIRAILRRLPRQRHSLFFSATMPKAIADLAASMLHEPAQVAVTPVARTADKVDQRVVLVDKANKGRLLAEVLSSEPIDRALVFTRTKHGADKVVRTLARTGIAAEAIHGNKSQNQRDRVLAAFRSGHVRILVATDIAARGIDVTGVSHVVNYDLPNVPESYVHRIGRTARAGREGIAISFCDQEERAYLRSIERLIKIQIPHSDRRGAGERFEVPAGEPIVLPEPSADPMPGRGRRGGNGQGQNRGRARQGNGGEGAPRGEKRASFQGEGRAEAPRGENRGGEGRGKSRGARGQRAASENGALGALGFMKAVPNRDGARKGSANKGGVNKGGLRKGSH
ncbi:MAG: DEAD/DEAH box helicase [Xanthobacter sp.]